MSWSTLQVIIYFGDKRNTSQKGDTITKTLIEKNEPHLSFYLLSCIYGYRPPNYTWQLSVNSVMETSCLYTLFSVFLLLATKFYTSRKPKLPPSSWPTLPFLGHLYLLKPPLHQTYANGASESSFCYGVPEKKNGMFKVFIVSWLLSSILCFYSFSMVVFEGFREWIVWEVEQPREATCSRKIRRGAIITAKQ